MRRFLNNLTSRITRKQAWLGLLGLISFLLFTGLTVWSGHVVRSLTDQQMAGRWSDEGGVAQVSCFLSADAGLTPEGIAALEHSLDAALTEVSVTPPNEKARLWVDSYSARGKVTVQGQQSKVEVNAIGVGGDFFLFHPLELLSGSYFSGSDLMQDHIILDQDSAWQLFGSYDVEGMQVMIGNVPHIVSGVIRREESKMNKMAGNGESTVYLSYDSLTRYGNSQNISAYEVVMPNPISAFALSAVRKNIGVDEAELEAGDNSKRFTLLSLLTVLKDFSYRSMNEKAIVYPYWENIARGWEDILAMVLVLRILFLLIPAVLLVILLVSMWRHRRWRFADLRDRFEDWMERRRLKRAQTPKKEKKKKHANAQ